MLSKILAPKAFFRSREMSHIRSCLTHRTTSPRSCACPCQGCARAKTVLLPNLQPVPKMCSCQDCTFAETCLCQDCDRAKTVPLPKPCPCQDFAHVKSVPLPTLGLCYGRASYRDCACDNIMRPCPDRACAKNVHLCRDRACATKPDRLCPCQNCATAEVRSCYYRPPVRTEP
jgi:hypothetical protein